jgi:predicted secreted protein
VPVPVPEAIAIYFTIWWIVLFAVLPFGVKSQQEADDVVPGTDRGAPMAPLLMKKAFWTTMISLALFAVLIAAIRWVQAGG